MYVPNLAPDLRAAVDDYKFRAPNGEEIWCPFALANMPCLPDPATDVLTRPGAGKASPADFQTAAAYVYALAREEEPGDHPVGEQVRLRLANGSLPPSHDQYNYLGVDCSRLVTHVLHSALGKAGIDLFQQLFMDDVDVKATCAQPPHPVEPAMISETMQRLGEGERLSVDEYVRSFYPLYMPERRTNINLLEANSVIVDDVNDIQPGDIGIYTPDSDAIRRHIAVVLGRVGNTRIKFAHSGRLDPAIERGGVQMYTLRLQHIANREARHGHRGTLTIRRLNFLAQET